jgi:hypothetical protein
MQVLSRVRPHAHEDSDGDPQGRPSGRGVDGGDMWCDFVCACLIRPAFVLPLAFLLFNVCPFFPMHPCACLRHLLLETRGAFERTYVRTRTYDYVLSHLSDWRRAHTSTSCDTSYRTYVRTTHVGATRVWYVTRVLFSPRVRTRVNHGTRVRPVAS